jgi:excisionase family DNA binding protein
MGGSKAASVPPPATQPPDDLGPLMTPGEVAKLFHVNPKTVTRWARSGKITSVRTLGGHRRYLQREIEALLNPAQATTPGIPR